MYGLKRVDKLIIDLAQDNKSGASELVRKAVKVFRALAEDYEGPSRKYYDELLGVGRKVIRAQPSMAPMFNCVNDLLCSIENTARSLMKDLTREWAGAYEKELEKARDWMIDNGKRIIDEGDTLAIYSYSSAVKDLLLSCTDMDISIITSEGRPVNEGLTLAETLGREGLRTGLYIDAALQSHVGEADKVLVGADAITERGVVNKIGTRGLGLSAKFEDVPFYVIAERNKFVLSGYFKPTIEEKSPLEITHRQLENVDVRNIYFDTTPFSLVTKVVTDEDLKTPDEAMEYLKGRKVCEDLLEEEDRTAPDVGRDLEIRIGE